MCFHHPAKMISTNTLSHTPIRYNILHNCIIRDSSVLNKTDFCFRSFRQQTVISQLSVLAGLKFQLNMRMICQKDLSIHPHRIHEQWTEQNEIAMDFERILICNYQNEVRTYFFLSENNTRRNAQSALQCRQVGLKALRATFTTKTYEVINEANEQNYRYKYFMAFIRPKIRRSLQTSHCAVNYSNTCALP